MEFILLDQDRSAHEVAHQHLTRILLEQHRGTLPVDVHCLHFSVRQLLKPRTDEDERVVNETLAGVDLIYSAGLYDYLSQPVAASLTKLLYGRLRPGGRLLIGNLVETADSTWVMDYILDWRLLYRTEETLMALANGLDAHACTVPDHPRRNGTLPVSRHHPFDIDLKGGPSTAGPASSPSSAHSRGTGGARMAGSAAPTIPDGGGLLLLRATKVASPNVQVPARLHDARANASSAAVW